MTLPLRDICIFEATSFACFTLLIGSWTCFRCRFTDFDEDTLIELVSGEGSFLEFDLVGLRCLDSRNNEGSSLQKALIVWLSSLFICLSFFSLALLRAVSFLSSTTSRFMTLPAPQWPLIRVARWCCWRNSNLTSRGLSDNGLPDLVLMSPKGAVWSLSKTPVYCGAGNVQISTDLGGCSS